jgi:hypothetical protein
MPRGAIARETFEHVILVCGHRASSHAIAIFPSGRRVYRCATCKCLRRREKGKTR